MLANTEQHSHCRTETSRQHQRVAAAAAVSLKFESGKTRLDRLYQQGSAKVRFPKTHSGGFETVFINTAGGLTGGDSLNWGLALQKQADVVVTTQACEKAYRSNSGTAKVHTHISLEADSQLHWLPQETILYDGSALQRQFDVELDQQAIFLAIEPVVLGREAMGEQLSDYVLQDRWRVRRAGKLIFADELRLSNPAHTAAGFGGNRAMASFLMISPSDSDVLNVTATELNRLSKNHTAAFSSFDNKITGRIVAPDSYHLRKIITPILKHVRGAELPRVWRI